MSTRISKNYLCTLDVNSTVDMEKLATIRETIKLANEHAISKHRVVVRGRKPVVKMVPSSHWLHPRTMKAVSYDWAGNIVGGLANATKLDVYIYRRYQ